MPGRFTAIKYLAVVAAISDKRGFITARMKLGQAFTREDMKLFFNDLRQRSTEPFVVLMDNARIHVSELMLSWYRQERFTVLRNLPYRPDLMGIELFWKQLKVQYRVKVIQHLAAGREWNQERLVKALLKEATTLSVKACACKGIEKLLKANPVDP